MKLFTPTVLFVLELVVVTHATSVDKGDIGEGNYDKRLVEKHGVLLANTCEVCRLINKELKNRLQELDVFGEINSQYNVLDSKPKKKIKYEKSELRWEEALREPHVCDQFKKYQMHKERTGIGRFDEGMSMTFKGLHALRDKGVKVDLGIPYELWDSPPAEVTDLMQKCGHLIEQFEDDWEDWYFNHSDEDPDDFVCRRHVLKNKNNDCLFDRWWTKEDQIRADKGETIPITEIRSKPSHVEAKLKGENAEL